MPFLFLNYSKNRYTWKEYTGNFVFVLPFLKYQQCFCNMFNEDP